MVAETGSLTTDAAAFLRDARVPVCDVCEQAPAVVTCRADAANLCRACDRDIHSANPLARRHERLPIVAFHHHHPHAAAEEFSEEEAEAASWLLQDPNARADPDPGSPECKSAENRFSDPDPDLLSGLHKQGQKQLYSADGVVPEESGYGPGQYPGPVVDGYPTYDVDYLGTKPFMYNFTTQSISHSVSSSEVGVVPDHNGMADVSNALAKTEALPSPLSGVDREARVLRYREKRKNRKFEKTIRYASRKAYAETRPRIKGRFAKRSELEVDSLFANDPSYGVVPTFLSTLAT